MKCRVCECTEENACVGGCVWIEPDLCSSCVEMILVISSLFDRPTSGQVAVEKLLERLSAETLKVIAEDEEPKPKPASAPFIVLTGGAA